MNRSSAPHRGRFAPSPTGPLHFGSLVAALASFCDARRADGEWLLRIEDVDRPRTQRGAEEAILDTLERYGFEWQGEVLRQAPRTAAYEAALKQLCSQDDVYPCACTRREIESAPLGSGGEHLYPGHCRGGIPAGKMGRLQRAWRLRVAADASARVDFIDRLQGRVDQDLAADVGDFVVRRADGLFAYQLAVVVDDAEQGITHVVRGADLLGSTPRQIYLQRRLGLPTPAYLHVPVAIDAGGEKLSKQTRAPALPPEGLPMLLSAWSFLGQIVPSGSAKPCSVREFWSFAFAAWDPTRLPPVAMLAAPHGTGMPDAGGL